jgi:uroporphyrinogen III methyltransferase/synthase
VADLAERVAAAKLSPPALTIIGKVVALRETMNWFERRPLFGETVLVTRTRDQASELSDRLMELGADVIEAPTIEIVPGDAELVRSALTSAPEHDWIVFTSANGARFTRDWLAEFGMDVRALGSAPIAVVGAETRDAVWKYLSLRAEVCSERAVAEGLADELAASRSITGMRFLLLRADIARPVLVERLGAEGAAEVWDVAVYETKPATSLPPELIEALADRRVTWATFTSSSTAKNLVSLLGEGYREQLAGVKIASIGPVTTATLRDLGLDPTVEARVASIDGLVEAITSTK